MDGGGGFHLLTPGAAVPDPLGVWMTAGIPQAFAMDQPVGENLVWRVDLPGDPARAIAVLVRQAAILATARAALTTADQRLHEFLAVWLVAPGEASFATAVGEPEAELAALLNAELDQATGAASYGPGAPSWAQVRQLARQAHDFLEQVRQDLSHFAWVETMQDGRRLSITVVEWLGDTGTAGLTALKPAQVELHLRALVLALDTRAGHLRLAAQLSQGIILVALALPTGNLALVAAGVWKFIRAIIAGK